MFTIKSGLRAFLAPQSAETLVQWLLEAAQQDPQLAAFLARKMESSVQPLGLAQRLRALILDATTLHDEINLRDTSKIAAKLELVLQELEPLLGVDQAALVIELSEFAIEQVEQALEQISDPNGDIGGVLESIGHLHLQACLVGQPDPVLLAERLFRYETAFPYETFLDSAKNYQAMLGDLGMQRFRELAEAEWRRAEQNGHGHENAYESGRWRITHMMEMLAQLSGDVDQLVAIKSRDLSSAHHYLQIAEIYHQSGRDDLALEWGKRGLQAFPERPDNRLRDFLAGLFLARGSNQDALELIWVQMETQPNLEHYRKLAEWSMQLDIWPLQRQRALQRVNAVIEQEARMVNRWKPQPVLPDQSLLVEIALWESDLPEAFRLSLEGQVRHEVLVALAAKLESTQLAQAIMVYRRILDDILLEGGDWGYLDVARLLQKYADLMTQMQHFDLLQEFLNGVRERFVVDHQLQEILSQLKM